MKPMLAKTITFLLAAMMSMAAAAQDFDRLFHDATLRIDYTLTGDADVQHIALDKMSRLPRWYGRRNNLRELPVTGNSQLTVTSRQTGDTLYRSSSSTLFQEWLTYPEARSAARSFEHVCLIPMPRDTVDVTVVLRDSRHQVTASYTHTVAPDDILIHRIGERNVAPYETIQRAADTTRCINIAFVAEGYRAEEMDSFLASAHEAVEALFAYEPFKSQRSSFNIVAVKTPSVESGTSEPGKGIWRNTAFGSHFDTFYSARYLTTLNIKALHDQLAGTPYEHIIVLVNSHQYGGGGILNCYNLCTSHDKFFRQVVVHEFGHSFAGLADEYFHQAEEIDQYPLDVEPWEPNITTKRDFASKWQDLVGKKGLSQEVGLYEGGGYRKQGVFRPCMDCRMRTNETPDFCPVCVRALRRVIDCYTAVNFGK